VGISLSGFGNRDATPVGGGCRNTTIVERDR
jgi:hypothetical protein